VTSHPSAARARRQRIQGATVGGVFGFAFLMANAETPLGQAAAELFRALAIAGLVALVVGRRRALNRSVRFRPATSDERVDLFGRRYWSIVGGEVAALAAGYGVIWQLGAPGETFLAWTVLVVGAHFLAFRLTGVWAGSIARTAGILVALGAAGLALAAASRSNWVPFVSGVLAGVTLLAGSLQAIRRSGAVGGRA
jgi:hypothetical protein